MIIFIYGEDTFRSREKLRALKDRFVRDVDKTGASVIEFDGKAVTAEKLHVSCASGGLFAPKRMIIVKEFLGAGAKDAQEQVVDFLPLFSKSENVIIFWEGKADKRTAIYKKLAKEKYSYEFALLDPVRLSKWVMARVDERGGKITRDAAQILSAEIGSDLWRLSGEVDKLVSYKGDGKTITENDVRELVKGSYEENIFALTDAVANRDQRTALQLIEHELSGGMNEIYLHTMLVRQFRILLQMKGVLEEEGRRANQSAVSKKLGLHPFVVKKSLPQADKYTASELKSIYGKLLDIDVKLKSTKIPPGVLFDLFVVRD